MAILCIDIESEFGAFNKQFSNSGGLLTYMVPPKTAIIGFIGAILGYDLKTTLEKFSNVKVGVEPLRQIETKSITYNCHYGGRPGRLVNIQQELLIKPRYRIYLEIDSADKDERVVEDINNLLEKHGITEKVNNVYDGLGLLLKNHISYYSLYMGKNDFPLCYKLEDIKPKKVKLSEIKKYFTTNCLIPKDSNPNPKITQMVEKFGGIKINRPVPFSFFVISNVPVSQNHKREFTRFKDFLLKDINSGAKMEILPQNKEDYAYYINEHDDIIVCF